MLPCSALRTDPPWLLSWLLPPHRHRTAPPHPPTHRYGFHGTSYRYLTGRAAALLGKPAGECNLVLCHLGAGSSMCAVAAGRSVDTTMGLTPLEGLMMGTRCGE